MPGPVGTVWLAAEPDAGLPKRLPHYAAARPVEPEQARAVLPSGQSVKAVHLGAPVVLYGLGDDIHMPITVSASRLETVDATALRSHPPVILKGCVPGDTVF